MTQPKGGWKNSALGDIFSHTVPRDTYVYPNTSSSNQTTPKSSSTPQPGDSGGSGSSNTGAIAGGVVGGVVVLALIGLAIWFFIWRPRHRSGQPHEGFGDYNKPELPGQDVRVKSQVRPGELEPRDAPAQLETNTDRAELDAYEYAKAMQGVQEPLELDAGVNPGQEERLTEQDQIRPKQGPGS